MRRVLVTGASGFIGRNCLRELARIGFEVHAVAHRRLLDVRRGENWHKADLLDPIAVHAVMRSVQPTHLLHCAWAVPPGEFWSSPDNRAWAAASVGLVTQFLQEGGRRVVAAGTCAEYQWNGSRCVEGLTVLRPATLYGVCKDQCRQDIAALSVAHNASFAWGRIFFVFGPHEQPERLIPSAIRSLIAGEKFVCRSGAQLRDYLYVEDVAAALVALVEHDCQGEFNVASGIDTSLRSVLERIAALVGRPDLIEFLDTTAESPNVTADATRLKQATGWKPRLDVDEGLVRTTTWWSSAHPLTAFVPSKI